jgi:hypothetical protein
MTKYFALILFLASTGAERNDMNDLICKLIPALIQVESGGDAGKIGDSGKAVGILQIHKRVVDDVNKYVLLYFLVYHRYEYTDRQDPIISKNICAFYLDKWGRHYELETDELPTLEVLARIWNGGPDGWKKKATLNYWEKVKTELARQEKKK